MKYPQFQHRSLCTIMNLIQSWLNPWQYLRSWQNTCSWLERKKTPCKFFLAVPDHGTWPNLALPCWQTLGFVPGVPLVLLLERRDGGSGLCSDSPGKGGKFICLWDINTIFFECLFSGVKPFQLGTLQLEEPPEIAVLIPEVLLLPRNGNIGLFTSSPPCPGCDTGPSPPGSSLTWQSSIGAGIQGEKKRRREPAPGAPQDSREGHRGLSQLRLSCTGWSI